MSREDVRGVGTDAETRCAHYGGDRDVVAIKLDCCETYFACIDCHAELTDHDAIPWPSDRRDESAVICGVCETTMSASAYLATEACPACEAAFNPDCVDHHHLYFEWIDAPDES